MNIYLASSLEIVKKYISDYGQPQLTVEAEYGDFVVEGTVYTAAHHQRLGSKYSGVHIGGKMNSPCNDMNIPFICDDDNILISHIDLDTIGGIMRSQYKYSSFFSEKYKEFWESVEFVDCYGWHKFNNKNKYYIKISAIAAWLQKNRPQIDRNNIQNVTDFIYKSFDFINNVFFEDKESLQIGIDFINDQNKLNHDSWINTLNNGLIIRKSNKFVNHLYKDKFDNLCKAVINFNTETKSITISLCDSLDNISCKDIVQKLWGKDAGGHEMIAGSPRGVIMNEDDFIKCINEFSNILNKYMIDVS